MFKLYPYFTNDGSVGLFSPQDDDIYHSTYGALSEAYEKFIIPSNLNDLLKKKNEIKLLDICFGIGYNSKSFLNEVIKFCYNESIDSDKIKYNYEIGSNNNLRNIFIHAVDNNKNLFLLSPFFISDKSIKNNKLPFKNEKIEKLLSKDTVPIYKFNNDINLVLLDKLLEYYDKDTFEIIKDKKYQKYFDKFLTDLCCFYKKWGYYSTPLGCLYSFLHNIYYKYISGRNKNTINILKLLNFTFKPDFNDARVSILADENIYDLIFLDAFTPIKCPSLWTIDYFKQLYNHLDNNGMIMTYSNSAQVRNAFLNAGFFVGKIFSDKQNKFTGTIAAKNNDLIKYELSEYDLGLIKTKAGIFYHDENLNLTNEAIIKAHKIEVENSNLESSSHFINKYRRNHNEEL